MLVTATKVGALILMALCTMTLGFFALMAESGGKESRPDVLLPLLLALGVVAFGVRARTTERPTATALSCSLAGLLALMPLCVGIMAPQMPWPILFATSWWGSCAAAVAAAVASRRAVRTRVSTNDAPEPHAMECPRCGAPLERVERQSPHEFVCCSGCRCVYARTPDARAIPSTAWQRPWRFRVAAALVLARVRVVQSRLAEEGTYRVPGQAIAQTMTMTVAKPTVGWWGLGCALLSFAAFTIGGAAPPHSMWSRLEPLLLFGVVPFVLQIALGRVGGGTLALDLRRERIAGRRSKQGVLMGPRRVGTAPDGDFQVDLLADPPALVRCEQSVQRASEKKNAQRFLTYSVHLTLASGADVQLVGGIELADVAMYAAAQIAAFLGVEDAGASWRAAAALPSPSPQVPGADVAASEAPRQEARTRA